MLENNKSREQYERPGHRPEDVHPLPPHLHGGYGHQPPHIRASRIRLDYDEKVIERLGEIYDDVEYITEILETCPLEIKLTLAMALGIQVDLSEYPDSVHPMVRFATPFLNEKNIELICNALNCEDTDAATRIYNACPPEQALLALAVAALIKTKGEV